MDNSITMLKKGDLLRLIDEVSACALASGALLPIRTGTAYVEDHGIRFVVRILSNLVLKDEDRLKRAQEKKGNPFLPYEKDLFVADISPTHLSLLNKFNVMERHLLIVTREFEEQEDLLTSADFEALWTCMEEYDAVGFYNGGEAAGASQAHKHLQIVPLPLADKGPAIPIQPLVDEVKERGKITRLDRFSFKHCFVLFEQDSSGFPLSPVSRSFALYTDMLSDLGMSVPREGEKVKQSGPYCLVVTRQWMLLVPRSREFYHDISVNSLGFAGCLLVRKPEHLKLFTNITGPLDLLREVSLPL
ncbi:MAG: phosphorylase [Nitrospirae bacterium]|nr:phosphorylase [Nitrospirota bacterium]